MFEPGEVSDCGFNRIEKFDELQDNVGASRIKQGIAKRLLAAWSAG